MTVSAESLKIIFLVVVSVTVNVINVELSNMDWLEVAVFTVVLLVDSIRKEILFIVFLVDSFASVS